MAGGGGRNSGYFFFRRQNSKSKLDFKRKIYFIKKFCGEPNYFYLKFFFLLKSSWISTKYFFSQKNSWNFVFSAIFFKNNFFCSERFLKNRSETKKISKFFLKKFYFLDFKNTMMVEIQIPIHFVDFVVFSQRFAFFRR